MEHTSLRLSLPPEIAFDDALLSSEVLHQLQLPKADFTVQLIRRSIDARNRNIKVLVDVQVYENGKAPSLISNSFAYKNVAAAAEVIIVGCGPAGLFAALRLIELGYKPIILERGKDVRSRRRDLVAITQEHTVNPDSNYCFGEGGAGTYSDGKLYTRANKRGDVRRVLETFLLHGAREVSFFDEHTHIGTNKLPGIVAALRETIIAHGGEIHFNTRVTDFVVDGGEMRGVITQNGDTVLGKGVILATGHSARDIFEILHHKNILIEAKPFAMGVRIEHPQELIDGIQYHGAKRGDFLPAAAYSLVCQVMNKGEEKGVFSFCMCPGGFIVPAATAQEEVVVNGMSPSKRDSRFANSGIVVSVDENSWKKYAASYGALAGLELQKELEKSAWLAGGKTQAAPAQRMMDFINKTTSSSLPETSYIPGLTSAPLHEVLPEFMRHGLHQAFLSFGNKMRGYLTNEAQIVGVESRTSSPVRIPRDKESFEHLQIKRLFPCAEGAGYAGGIVSAAMDGEKCAEKWVEKYG
ncbi:MAG: FAD-binding protein [Bacteroidetes bacterium]|nr:FAD-binding protein [Bacteroidota bacterium]